MQCNEKNTNLYEKTSIAAGVVIIEKLIALNVFSSAGGQPHTNISYLKKIAKMLNNRK